MPEVKIDTWDLYSRPFYILTVSAVLLILSSLLWGGYLLRAIRREKGLAGSAGIPAEFTSDLIEFDTGPGLYYDAGRRN